MAPAKLYLSYDADFDWLMAFELGRTTDRNRHWRGVSERFGFALDRPEGREIGFHVKEFSQFDPEELSELFGGPRFDAPVLGLWAATAGEICLAAAPFFGGYSSLNRLYFDAAVGAENPERAAFYWKLCLQAGDMMAHYGLGYSLLELGRSREAYRHLRAYTEIVPLDSWAWCYRGRAAEAIGDRDDARTSYLTAIRIGSKTDEETDADELLEALDARREAA